VKAVLVDVYYSLDANGVEVVYRRYAGQKFVGRSLEKVDCLIMFLL
jgi:hypothetical protein